MSRTLILSNDNILVGYDDNYKIADFYYPHIGEENHAGTGIHLGVYSQEQEYLSWLSQDSEAWEVNIDYQKRSLVGKVKAVNKDLQVKLNINDFVHFNFNFLGRKITIKNLQDSPRTFKLFQAQDYHILETSVTDTAFFDEKTSTLIHYEKDRYFLHGADPQFESFAAGEIEKADKKGTWFDAEDGTLSQNQVSHGSVDSVIGNEISLEPGEEETIFYWIAVGKDLKEVRNMNQRIKEDGVEQFLQETSTYWDNWLKSVNLELDQISPEIKEEWNKSLLLVRTHLDEEGAVIASTDSYIEHFAKDHYSYCWPRDAAWIITSLQEIGKSSLSIPFYKFCERVIKEDGFLMQKYWCSGCLASTWHKFPPLQEDETASVIASLGHFYQKTGQLSQISRLYEELIKPAAEKMDKYRYEDGLPRETWNLWEERWQINTYTCASVYRGLKEAANFARCLGEPHHARDWDQAAAEVKEGIISELYDPQLKRFVNGITRYNEFGEPDENVDKTIDASISGLFLYQVLDLDDERLINTMNQIEENLKVNGGIARYEDDEYFRVSPEETGNPWINTTLFTAWWHISTAQNQKDLEPAADYINWVKDQSLGSGILPEQVNPESGEPVGVSPLTWSHALFILVVKKYNDKQKELNMK